MGFDYREVERQVVDTVDLISVNSDEWQDYKRRIHNHSNTNHERQQIIETADIYHFTELLNALLNHPNECIDGIREALVFTGKTWPAVTNFNDVLEDFYHGREITVKQPDTPPTRGWCRHSRSDRYRDDEDAYCCWECSDKPNNRPVKFNAADDPVDECETASVSTMKLEDYIINNTELDTTTEWGRVLDRADYSIYQVRRLVQALREEGYQRTEALKLAWRGTIPRHDYHYQRAEAVLRDIDSPLAKEKSPGGGGHEFEEEARTVLDAVGFELSEKRVFRITFRDDAEPERLPEGANRDEPYYKEADIITESTEPTTIIEVFTERNREEKSDQLQNYQMLYSIATDTWPQGMLLTDQTGQEVLTLDTIRQLT